MLKPERPIINPITKRFTLKITRAGKRMFNPHAKSAKAIAVITQIVGF
jgi:hypothetical protein